MTTARAQRTPFRLPVSIGRRAAALSADVSTEGFCLETPQMALAPGREIDGYVLHGDKELGFKGVVAWVHPGSPQASTWHRLGVRFTHVSPGLRALLSLAPRRRFPVGPGSSRR